jgi:Lon protease-like protein
MDVPPKVRLFDTMVTFDLRCPMSDRPDDFNIEIPSELPLLPLAGTVVFPLTVVPLGVSRPEAVALIDAVMEGVPIVGLVARRTGDDQPYTVGTAAQIHRLLRLPDGSLRVAAQGLSRISVRAIIGERPWLRASVALFPETTQGSDVMALLGAAVAMAGELAQLVPAFPLDIQADLLSADSVARALYLLAASAVPHASLAERQGLLEQEDVGAQLVVLQRLLERELTLARRAPPRLGPAQMGLLERRSDLLALPLAQEIFAAGRVDGKLAALRAVLRVRFPVGPRRDALEAHLTIAGETMLDQMLALAATTRKLADLETAIATNTKQP